jgi:serine/threonine protein kinase
LKPENILISIDKKKSKKTQPMTLEELVNYIKLWEYKIGGIENIKNEIKLKIIDFNKSFDENLPIKPLNIQTLYYTPPEIIIGDYFYNNSVDIWTCTCILYEMLTNKHMFNIGNKKSLEDDGENGEDDSEDESEDDNEDYGEELDEYINHLALLHQYNYMMGKYPEELLNNAKYESIYFNNKILKGNCMEFENNISKFTTFNTFFNEIILRTFKYNYKERLSIEEYIKLYIRTL